jgi:hypothetical protein
MWCAPARFCCLNAADDGSPRRASGGRVYQLGFHASFFFAFCLFVCLFGVAIADDDRVPVPLFHAAIPWGFQRDLGFLREGLSLAILPGFFAREFRRRRVFPSSQHAARAPPAVSSLRILAISLSSSLLLLSNLCFFTPPPRLIPAGGF